MNAKTLLPPIRNTFLLMLPLALGSCSPHVFTQVTQPRPQRVSAEQVHLYEVGDSLPTNTQRIGFIKVVDAGLSTRCNYDQVVARAKQATAANGGNLLALTEHRKPSLKSSCHQIAGEMLWTNDTIDWSRQHDALQVPAQLYESEQKRKLPRTLPAHTLYINAGYAFITSKYYVPSNFSGNPKQGPDWQAGYEWTSRSGWGAGALYSGYHTSYSYQGFHYKAGLCYIAPQVFYKIRTQSWVFAWKAGMGYFNWTESLAPQKVRVAGFGYNFLMDAEYMLSEHAGIGANVGYIAGILPKQKEWLDQIGAHETPGVFRLHVDIGLRIHF